MLLQLIILLFLVASIQLLVDVRTTPDRWSVSGRVFRVILYALSSVVGGGIILEVGRLSPVSALMLLPVLGLSVWQLIRIFFAQGWPIGVIRVISIGLVIGMLGVAHVLPVRVAYVFTVENLVSGHIWQPSINPDAEYRVRV